MVALDPLRSSAHVTFLVLLVACQGSGCQALEAAELAACTDSEACAADDSISLMQSRRLNTLTTSGGGELLDEEKDTDEAPPNDHEVPPGSDGGSHGEPAAPSLVEQRAGDSEKAVEDHRPCSWEGWTSYDRCTKTCGGGEQKRSRTCRSLLWGAVKRENQKRSCYTQPCPRVNCRSTWGSWSSCDKSCGGGKKFRKPVITVYPLNGGTSCPHAETETCNTAPCDCEGTWSDWTPCSTWVEGRLAPNHTRLFMGSRSRQFTIVQKAEPGGEVCPSSPQAEWCQTEDEMVARATNGTNGTIEAAGTSGDDQMDSDEFADWLKDEMAAGATNTANGIIEESAP